MYWVVIIMSIIIILHVYVPWHGSNTLEQGYTTKLEYAYPTATVRRLETNCMSEGSRRRTGTE